jgi:PAS domain S-box-containing protein
MKRVSKFTIGFSIITLVILGLLSYVGWKTIDTYQSNYPYQVLTDNLQKNAAIALSHLQRGVNGDATIVFETHINKPITTSWETLQSHYSGQENNGIVVSRADETTRAMLKESVIYLEKLKSTFQLAWNEKSVNAEVYSAVEAYHRHLEQLRVHTQASSEKDISYVHVIWGTSIALILLLLFTVGYVVYRFLVKSDKELNSSRIKIDRQAAEVSIVSGFIESISAGDYTVSLNLSEENNLRNTLITMRDKLRVNAENDRKRNWTTSGLAQVGEILRTNSGTTTELYDNIVRFVVKYTNSNQGGLFIMSEDDQEAPYLELVACYAFERKKYLTKRIAPGEGLVGQCYLEGQRIYLLEVPNEYITITSGLGGANPNALLIVPLKVNDTIFGVLEIATFGSYEDYQIELVEKLAESIGSTISTVRVNESTKLLLAQTQEQAEQMRSQEEEMRQNMEELEATQDEMRRKEKHIQEMLDKETQRNEISMRNRKVSLELNKNSDIQNGNWEPALEKLTSTIAVQLNTTRCAIWLLGDLRNTLECEKFYSKELGTFSKLETLHARKYPSYFEAVTGEEIILAQDANTHPALRELSDDYFQTHHIQSRLDVPFYNEGRIAGIISCEQQGSKRAWTEEDVDFLKTCSDLITVCYNSKKINAMIENMNDAQETLQTIIDNLPRAIFWKDRDLRFLGCNRVFAKIAGMNSPRELIGKTDNDMPWRMHAEAYRVADLAVMEGKKATLDQEERNVSSTGQESWILTSKVPILNQQGDVVAVLGMFEDITLRKQKDAEYHEKMKEFEQLKKMLEARTV